MEYTSCWVVVGFWSRWWYGVRSGRWLVWVSSCVWVCLGFIFFFSSRRRHTRCLSDWSSDVCSSDLITGASNAVNLADGLDGLAAGMTAFAAVALGGMCYITGHVKFSQYLQVPYIAGTGRSEERRVGKECRSRGSEEHENKQGKRERG